MNTRELVHYINQIVNTIPIVMSFNDTDPYTYWNSQEVKYGSVIFAVKGYNQLSGVTRYNCVIYYGDRVLKDESNVNNIYTDAQTTINTVITNVELADGTITVTSGSPSITFFRQRFLDELAGGYCNFTIEVEDAIGACGYGHGDIVSPGGGSIEIEVLEEKIKELTKEVSQLEAEVEVKDGVITELRAEIVELNEEIEELKKGVQPYIERIAVLEAQIGVLNNEIDQLESTIESKDATIANLNAEITRLQGVIDTKDAEIAGLENRITELNAEITRLQGVIDTKDATIANLNAEITRLEGVIATLNTKTVNYMFGQVQSSAHVFYYDGDDGGDYSAIIAELPAGWTAVALHDFSVVTNPADANVEINVH